MLNNINSDNNKTIKIEIEQQVDEQQTYKLVGTFMRNKSLKLFSYNHMTGNLEIVDESKNDELHLVNIDGKLRAVDKSHTEANINTKHTQFEALNVKSALKRIEKFKTGKIKSLDNLKTYNPKPIINYRDLSI